ncbi:YugN family protein [Bacillus sp. S/N-304-OC-R1]|uniref:YugN family protein n=1 Tax=Bacillus sp. S/N-304-OC-R1 TaxID=2758034 RepID=UPI001C8DABE9|nr:YugN family protein [Bacillus sp. S/N-304-OC-R1]MBY0120830.1 hypothetical protein [Bacillus sp. S/N-304-OC-R1]
MKFENTGIEKKKADLVRLDEVMLSKGLVREGQWDYERVTYDRKFDLKEGIYYLRVFGQTVEGEIDTKRAVIELKTPVLGKYYYPHGVEYGDDEVFPKSLVSQCQKILTELNEEIGKFAK